MDTTTDSLTGGVSLAPLLRSLVATTPVEVACGGVVVGESGHFVIDELLGVRTDGLRDLLIDRGHGVGGKALALNTPVHVRNYFDARGITHRYDAAVREERLQSMFAVPVQVRGGPRAVVYGAMRRELLIGQPILDAAMQAVRRFEQETAVDVEVRRRLRALLGPDPGAARPAAAAQPDMVREIYAELALIAASVPDETSRSLVQNLMRRLTGSSGPGGGKCPAPRPALTRREIDVLAQVALGCSNDAAAERLGVLPSTVKGYLKSASRKLGARNRVEAAELTRRHGLLP